MKSAAILSVLIIYSIAMIDAFTVSSSRVSSATNSQTHFKTLLQMSEEKPSESAASKDGTLYDDEVAEYKPAISNSMREKLLAEASTGLDSEKKQTNVILYISVAVAILVALGGSGTLY